MFKFVKILEPVDVEKSDVEDLAKAHSILGHRYTKAQPRHGRNSLSPWHFRCGRQNPTNHGDLMVFNGDLMVINGDLMVINGDLMGKKIIFLWSFSIANS